LRKKVSGYVLRTPLERIIKRGFEKAFVF